MQNKGAKRRRKFTPAQRSERVYVRLARDKISVLKFLLEAYDNLGYLSVLDPYEAVALLVFSPDQAEEMGDFLRDAAQRAPHEVIPFQDAAPVFFSRNEK